ncbi:hypothetical protein AMK59_6830 [Oryctes borbonicus]|uniref:Uncharacterized protein n=1 Tax=Oryctes borbonicus TaxID=1629725 RepID=A0A0T6AWG0_9SCAR|nr:hypothetical protein AMK59_6830 [Oryctes borbonicus]
MSSPGGVQSAPSRRQKRMGPAPFASFEDLSDEVRSHLESPDETIDGASLVRLPGIREDVTPSTPASQGRITPEFVYTGISLVGAPSTPPSSTAMSSVSTPQSSTKASLQTPSTPRIDISRASSSSHHEDSRDSTPERELFEGHDPERAKLGLGFREEGTLDLRSSTEELDFQDTQLKMKKVNVQTPSQDEFHNHQRKDSQSSEIGLLSISGRTSRLSSIGSQGSTHSRMSNASHLSVISGQSGVSRSPSPHKMLLETSFCGTKSTEARQRGGEKHGTKCEREDLEIALLSRKADPTKAILAEGISVDTAKSEKKLLKISSERPSIKRENVQAVKTNIKITVDKPPITTYDGRPKIPKTIIGPSGVEYTYIPLKGPLPKDDSSAKREIPKPKPPSRTATTGKVQAGKQKSSASKGKERSQLPPVIQEKKEEEPKYIRIKLKPDHMYEDYGCAANMEIQKPVTLDLNDVNKRSIQSFKEILQTDSKAPDKIPATRPSENQGRSISSTPSASPKLSRHSVLKEPVASSKSPSPSLSRKSSFASIFRSKEAILSPESPTIPSSSGRRKNTLTGIIKDASENLRERRRSRSKSRDRDRSSLSVAPSSTESIDSKGKQKTVFSLFKCKKERKSESDSNSSDVVSNVDVLTNVEFKFKPEPSSQKSTKKYNETQLEGDSIRIPLHSPTFYEQKSLLQELRSSSQGSQETVIEANISKGTEATVTPDSGPVQKTKVEQLRQSSTSSENIVFSTRLGSNNEIFTTKLPKEKLMEKSPVSTVDTTKVETDIGAVEKTISKQNSIEAELIGNSTPSVDNTILKLDEAIPKTCSLHSITDARKVEEPLKDKPPPDVKPDVAKINRNSVISAVNDEDHYSSESERGSEIDFLKEKKKMELKLDSNNSTEPVEMERKGLVVQQDSFEDELPYVPTTLPLERSVAVPIIPVKQRNAFEMKVYPIERPRSTTPINPSCLEEYCEEIVGTVHIEQLPKTIEKLKISLPREDSIKSPRRSTGNTNWLEFAEKKIATQQRRASLPHESDTTTTSPPPLPAKGLQKEWINFEEIPERRKPPKRIQTIPSRGNIEVPESVLQDNVVYSYVNPEDCKCECHEFNARSRNKENQRPEVSERVHEDELPLLEEDVNYEEKPVNDNIERIKLDVTILDRRSVISDSSVDLSTSIEHAVEANGVECLQTPFTSDLGVSSNRSSIISQDDAQSPDRSPNAFPKTSS